MMDKGNPNHAPAGSPKGGQFTSGHGVVNAMIRKGAGISTDIEHAKGVLAARDLGGVQFVGASNIKRAEAVLSKQGLEPIEKKIKDASTFKFANEYKNRRPIVGDRFIFPKGTVAEISAIKQTPVGKWAIDYIEITSKDGRVRTFYLDELVGE
jgi:hypothetical protein